jgi:hypothetical protein
VVAVTLGVATLVSGTGGGVVVVTVCAVACGGDRPAECSSDECLTAISPDMAKS